MRAALLAVVALLGSGCASSPSPDSEPVSVDPVAIVGFSGTHAFVDRAICSDVPGAGLGVDLRGPPDAANLSAVRVRAGSAQWNTSGDALRPIDPAGAIVQLRGLARTDGPYVLELEHRDGRILVTQPLRFVEAPGPGCGRSPLMTGKPVRVPTTPSATVAFHEGEAVVAKPACIDEKFDIEVLVRDVPDEGNLSSAELVAPGQRWRGGPGLPFTNVTVGEAHLLLQWSTGAARAWGPLRLVARNGVECMRG